jgi:hypothetical protein
MLAEHQPIVNLGPVVQAWGSAIKAAAKAKDGFQRTGDMCKTFLVGACDAMWQTDFRGKFLGGMPAPQFRIVLNKTFELCSIVGPGLMWANAGRIVENWPRMDIDPLFYPALLGLDPNSPEGQQAAQDFVQEVAMEESVNKTRNAIVQQYLNCSQTMQPGGGLRDDSRLAVIDALVKGRGVLKVDTWKPYGTDNDLTGAFWVDVDDLFIDPDCTRGNLEDAKWIAIRHRDKHWAVERRFGWPPGSLKSKGASSLSHMGAAEKRTNSRGMDVKSHDDICTWYEVFSLCGVGTRFASTTINSTLHQTMEQYVGDEAYICFIPGVNELLNLRNQEAERIELEQLKPRLDWPIPHYKDHSNKWPVALLDFWDNPGSAWPIATVSAGLGQLICINIILSSITERIYRDSLDKFAIREDVNSEIRAKLLSLKAEVIDLNSAAGDKIGDFISYIERPQLNFDVWRILDELSMSFDKAVGLMELMYGLNPGGKVSRTAADANIKGDAVGVRPEFMAARVEEWQTRVANIERTAAGYVVAGETITPLLGKHGAMLWTKLITEAPEDVYIREMKCTIEAGSTRRPNKVREAQNMQQIGAIAMPIAQWYAQATGNTEPLNRLIRDIGKSVEQETEDWTFPPIPQQGPPPEEQERMAIELEKSKQSVDKLALNNKAKAHELLERGIGLSPEQAQGATPIDEGVDSSFLGEEFQPPQ